MEIVPSEHPWRRWLLNAVLVLMPVWFPYLYTGIVLMQMKLTHDGPLGMRGLYFLVFIVAGIANRPIFKGQEMIIFTNLFIFFFYLVALAVGHVLASLLTILAV